MSRADGAGDGAAMLSALLQPEPQRQSLDCVSGIADKPCVILKFSLFAEAFASGIADDLSRAGLALISIRQLNCGASAAGSFTTPYIASVIFCSVIQRSEALFAYILRIFQHVRLLEDTAAGDAADGTASCKGVVITAPVRWIRNYFAFVPLSVEIPVRPIRAKHEPGLF